jgi:hypothetical protein
MKFNENLISEELKAYPQRLPEKLVNSYNITNVNFITWFLFKTRNLLFRLLIVCSTFDLTIKPICYKKIFFRQKKDLGGIWVFFQSNYFWWRVPDSVNYFVFILSFLTVYFVSFL